MAIGFVSAGLMNLPQAISIILGANIGTTMTAQIIAFNEDYCKWCYSDGEFKYTSKEQLIDFCVEHMTTETWPAEQVRAHMEAVVPNLKHWK